MILWYNKRLLTQGHVTRLQKHKYNVESNSILDPYFQHWWNWVVTFAPMWLAPNLITITGLAINLMFTLLLILKCPTATEEVPGWIPFTTALALFSYQTLDAIDGKQARRTGSSNALGELFDHGCDSINCIAVTLAGACAMGMGYLDPYWMLGYCFLSSFLFYLSQWQTYVTGKMRFGRCDVTEATVTMIGVLMMTGLFGTHFWGFKLFGFLSLRVCPLLFGVTGAILSMPSNANQILFNGAGKNGSTVAGSSVIAPIIPWALVFFPALYIAANSTELVFEKHALLYIFVFTLMASKATNKLIVAQMTKSELEIFDPVFLCSLLMIFNQSKGPFISEYNLLLLVAIFVITDYILHVTRICKDICDMTGWYLFKINVAGRSKNGSKSK